MAPVSLPTVFVSHGAPTLPLERGEPAREFLATLGGRYPGIRAILCVSAHWNTPRPAVTLAEHPKTLHDFSGFPAEAVPDNVSRHRIAGARCPDCGSC